MALVRNAPRNELDAIMARRRGTQGGGSRYVNPETSAPYKDLLYGSRGDTITTTGDNGQVTSVAGGNPPAAEEAEAYDFTASPGYDWRFSQGQRGVENALVSRGLGLSGRAAKELTRFGQGFGADEFNAEFARNATLAGLQPPAIGSMNALVGNFGANAGNIMGNMGQFGANSAYNNANMWGNAINNISQAWGSYYGQPRTHQYAGG